MTDYFKTPALASTYRQLRPCCDVRFRVLVRCLYMIVHAARTALASLRRMLAPLLGTVCDLRLLVHEHGVDSRNVWGRVAEQR